jgi:hypothetical protein
MIQDEIHESYERLETWLVGPDIRDFGVTRGQENSGVKFKPDHLWRGRVVATGIKKEFSLGNLSPF